MFIFLVSPVALAVKLGGARGRDKTNLCFASGILRLFQADPYKVRASCICTDRVFQGSGEVRDLD